MTKIAGRTYRVSATDFPIQVDVVAENLPLCQAVASNVQVVRGGAVVSSFPVRVNDDPANLAIHYAIPLPAEQPPVDLVQVVGCFFPDPAPGGALYEFTITAAGGEVEKTEGSAPTLNPRNVTLTFEHR